MKAKVVAVVVLGLVMIVLAWNFLFFAPAGRSVDTARARRDSALATQADLAAQLRELQTIGTEGPAWRAKVARLGAMIPTTPRLDEFIRAANSLKASSGVDWVSIQPSAPSAPAAPGGPTEIKMQVVVTGGYFQVLDYLDRLESLRRLVVVDSIDVATGAAAATNGSAAQPAGAVGASVANSSSHAPRLSVTLAARMFTQAAPPAVAPAPGPSGGSAPSTSTSVAVPTTLGGSQ